MYASIPLLPLCHLVNPPIVSVDNSYVLISGSSKPPFFFFFFFNLHLLHLIFFFLWKCSHFMFLTTDKNLKKIMVPPWLESLLLTAFFTICPRHRDTPRNECNMYCLDCMNDAFCFYCRSSRHKDHLVIQVHIIYIFY